MSRDQIRQALAAYVLGRKPNDQEALALMLLLHTHHFWVESRADDGFAEWDALTQRHAATTSPAVGPDIADAQRTAPYYWFSRFNDETPYEVVEDMPEPWLALVLTLKQRLLGHPDIERIEPED